MKKFFTKKEILEQHIKYGIPQHEKRMPFYSDMTRYGTGESGKEINKQYTIHSLADGNIFGVRTILNDRESWALVLFLGGMPIDEYLAKYKQDIMNMLQHDDKLVALGYHNGDIKRYLPPNRSYNPNKFRSQKMIRDVKPIPGFEEYYQRIPEILQRGTEESRDEIKNRFKLDNKQFKKILNDYFDGEGGVNDILSRLTLPPIPIKPKDSGNYEFRKFMHQDTETGNSWKQNEPLFYIAKAFIGFEDKKDFLKTVITNLKGTTPDNFKSEHLARQYAGNWDPRSKKTSKTNYGKTDIYKLDKSGFSEEEYVVIIEGELKIEGLYQGNNYVWSIIYKPRIAKKRSDEAMAKEFEKMDFRPGDELERDEELTRMFPTLDKTIIATGSVPVNKEEYGIDKKAIMQDPAVQESLIQTIEDFKEKLKSISPKEMLRYSKMTRADVERVDESVETRKKRVVRLKESDVKNLVETMIKKYKIKKK